MSYFVDITSLKPFFHFAKVPLYYVTIPINPFCKRSPPFPISPRLFENNYSTGEQTFPDDDKLISFSNLDDFAGTESVDSNPLPPRGAFGLDGNRRGRHEEGKKWQREGGNGERVFRGDFAGWHGGWFWWNKLYGTDDFSISFAAGNRRVRLNVIDVYRIAWILRRQFSCGVAQLWLPPLLLHFPTLPFPQRNCAAAVVRSYREMARFYRLLLIIDFCD